MDAANLLEGNSQSDDQIELSLNGEKDTGRKTRTNDLRELLTAKGALTRREIVENTKWPTGTISTLLAKKEIFTKNEHGKWRVV